MEKLMLNAEIRNTEEKLSEVRNAKMIPAVVYGKTQEPIIIKMNYSEFLKLYRISGESHIINISIEGKEIEVLVHEVQNHPVSGNHLHVDFYAITRGQAVHTHIHINFTGESAAVKEGAILEEHLKELEIKCLPRHLVDAFDVDLTVLKEMGDNIRVSDLDLGKNYEILTNSDDVVASASKPKVIVETEEEVVAPTTEEVTEEK